MTTALIVFIGGMMIVFFYPGVLKGNVRVFIGIFVALYFIFRMSNSIMAIRHERRRKQGLFSEDMGKDNHIGDKPKSS